MIDKTSNEVHAIQHAGMEVGRYIDTLVSSGRGSDFANWTPEEYFQMIEVGVEAYNDRLTRLALADDVPF